MSQDSNHRFQGQNMHNFVSEALVAVGSNREFGEMSPAQIVQAAIDQVGSGDVRILKVSRFYQTPSFPPGSGPDFVNAAFLMQWERSADELLHKLHIVESSFGRERNQRWDARSLDLDLIALGDHVLPNPETHAKWRDLDLSEQKTIAPDTLILPHPRLQERAFVLTPLADVAPDWRHPVLKLTVREMLDALPDSDKAGVIALEYPANRA